ncbi:MAG: peptidoglycan DD-metalloendopeptidase family protein [Flavobacteriales bacterium]
MNGKKNIVKKLFLGKQEIITDPITSEEKVLYKSSLFRFFIWFFVFGILIFFGTLYFTRNLNYTIFSNKEFAEIQSKNPEISKEATIRLLKRTDSLSEELEKYQLYVNSISDVIDGKVTASYDSLVKEEHLIPIADHKLDKDSIAPSKQDIDFRAEIIEDGFSTVAVKTDDLKNSDDKIVLFPPVKGIITSKYDIGDEHLAIDIACNEGEPIKAIMNGFVVFSDWTSGGGYVLVLQHKQNIISVYKHNSQLYKKQGDIVQSGDVIATAGSSGELSTGPHLHFELWIEGYAVDPETYIDF